MIAQLFIVFFVLMMLGMPLAYAMATASGLCFFLTPELPNLTMAQKMFTAMDSFSMLAIPFFMFAGSLMNETGITEKIIAFAKTIVGHFRGGLAQATVVTGVMLAGKSGSANADTSILAKIMVPALEKEGYEKGFSCSLVAGCGALAPVIPPSIMMVVYSGVTAISIASLFMAGIVPGLIIGGGYLIVNYLYARKRGIPKSHFVGLAAVWKTFKKAIWALMMPLIIIGGIMSGMVTATESGMIATVYGLIYGFASKNLTLKTLKKCIDDAVSATVNPMLIISFAGLFGFLITYNHFSELVMGIMNGITTNPYMILIIISIILLIAGMLLDANAALLMLVPIFAPLISVYGYDEIHFAMVCILTLVMGGMSPPVAMLLYIASSCTETPLDQVVKHIWPFLVVNYAVVILVIFCPIIVTWLPALM
ncbi:MULTISPECIES: TRAP transporter large permease [Anaerotruncus]|jgi:tripartite ATP-independent transporter DctM subunit|uniref:TRAP transporter large permease n=1 Tax=Anaerotruncus TaxID=244127 RepID=UPI00083021DE|nr:MULTISPECIES: TRAP transporter large permease [Anaerotruncus]RGX54711.1 TRAP transporter large permease [Anaerotruncus sp. AF02-27]